MYQGYLAIGQQFLGGQRRELINSSRVAAYIRNWNLKVAQGSEPAFTCGIDWYVGDDVCAEVPAVFGANAPYVLPELDPAPWYDATLPGTERFFGVVGLEVSGDEDSTQKAEVRQSVGGGGAVGLVNKLARELTVRALAVAADERGLSAGLAWMRNTYQLQYEPCFGDFLWFLSTCPDCGQSTETSGGLCWPATIGEYAANAANTGAAPPSCPVGTWWPSTIGEFASGPPPPSDPILANEWCTWLSFMDEYRTGLPEFACDTAGCTEPFVRQFHRVRVVSGPTVISRTQMNDGGFIAEVEFVVACADPDHYSPGLIFGLSETAFTPEEIVTDESAAERRGFSANPFHASTPLRASQPVGGISSMPSSWRKQAIEFWPRGSGLPGFRADIALDAIDSDTEHIRVGIWDPAGKELLGGWYIPKLPVGTSILIDGGNRLIRTFWNGEMGSNAGGAVVNYDGSPTVRYPQLRSGVRYIVTIEQDAQAGEPDFAVRLSGVGTS